MSRERRVRLGTMLPMVTVLVLAAVALGWLLPSAVAFFPVAPAVFWGTAGLAVLVDTPLFIDQGDNTRVRSTLSASVCFAIFVVWGAGPAVVVQVVAAVVSAIGQRYFLLGTLLFVARLVVAFAVVKEQLTLTWHASPTVQPGAVVTGAHVVEFLELVAVWMVVSQGLLIVADVSLRRRGWWQRGGQVRDEFLISAAALLVVTPLLIVLPSWYSLLIGVPLLALNFALRFRIQYEKQLRREPVTGLLSRRGLAAHVDTLTRQDKFGVRPFALVLVNAGSLLGISRALGRGVYEGAAIQGARRLTEAYGNARVGMLSGEGYVLLMPEVPAQDPLEAAEAVARLLAPPVEVGGIPFSLEPAVGVALSPEHGRDLDTLLGRAELAMSQARRNDRMCALYVSRTAASSRRRIALLAELHATLRDPDRHDEITLLYQPQVELASRRLVGVEALFRWTHPRWGPVRTDELIDAVETSEVMHVLTSHVLETTAAQVQVWNERGFAVRAAVNASVQDLRDPDFAHEIAAAMGRHGLVAGQLTIEITERLVDVDNVRISRACADIVGLGVGLSVDDFGTGYASLQQLRLLPLTEVKIDQSYVTGMLGNPSERAIVASVHQLCDVLGLAMVAEGVEDEQTAAALSEFAGVIAQGWYFGRPMTADEVYERWHHAYVARRS